MHKLLSIKCFYRPFIIFIMTSPKWKHAFPSADTLEWHQRGLFIFLSGIVPSWRPEEAPPNRRDTRSRSGPTESSSQPKPSPPSNEQITVRPRPSDGGQTCFELPLSREKRHKPVGKLDESRKRSFYEEENIRASELELSLTSKQKRRVCGATLRGPDWVQMEMNSAGAGHSGETDSTMFPLHSATSQTEKKQKNSIKATNLHFNEGWTVYLLLYCFCVLNWRKESETPSAPPLLLVWASLAVISLLLSDRWDANKGYYKYNRFRYVQSSHVLLHPDAPRPAATQVVFMCGWWRLSRQTDQIWAVVKSKNAALATHSPLPAFLLFRFETMKLEVEANCLLIFVKLFGTHTTHKNTP